MTTTDLPRLRGYYPLQNVPERSPFNRGDVLVLFGEVFQRGYANGLLEQAHQQRLSIVRCTMGRRDENGELRALTHEEKLLIPEPFINIPLEAGFDLEKDEEGLSLVDRLKNVKLSDWQDVSIPPSSIEQWQKKGQDRLRRSVKDLLRSLERMIPEKCNVFFAHLMAGGIPRSKIVMPLMNRVVKGQGDRFLDSKTFWDSSIGQACAANFIEVTAESYRILIEETESLRNKLESRGNRVCYAAYGYHGTEILTGGKRIWQTYTPYLQGWAKLALENHSRDFFKAGVSSCVYNCPEILTQSSHVFQGVEVSLYPLVDSLLVSANSNVERQKTLAQCQLLLKNSDGIDRALKICENYFKQDLLQPYLNFDIWPQHSSREQLELMLSTSDALIELHQNPKQLMTQVLSEVVLNACGFIMLNDIWSPKLPVAWVGHQLVADLL